MRTLVAFLCLFLQSLAWPGAAAPNSGALDRAEAALMDGDFQRAASLAGGVSGSEAARILGEALEAQGDLKGAAKAYARAAEDPEAAAWLAKRAQTLEAAADKAEVAPTPVPTPVPTKAVTAIATPTPPPTFTPLPSPTPIPTAQPSAVPTVVPTQARTEVPTPVTTPAPAPDAALEKERQALAKERQALEDEKAALEQKRKAMAAGYEEEKPTQGLTLYGGVGGYWAKVVEKFNDAIRLDSQGNFNVGSGSSTTGNGPSPQTGFPLSEALGLRWEGFVVEGTVLDQEISYNKPVGTGTGQSRASLNLTMISLGYDWAFVRRGGILGPVELALPLHVDFSSMNVEIGGIKQSANRGGPAFGLSLRYWVMPRLMLELEGLYHLQPGEDNGGGGSDSSSAGGGGNCGNNCGGSTGSNDTGSQDGINARFNLGWRFL
jgi:tetratricopeptide (TPR) repeat protein